MKKVESKKNVNRLKSLQTVSRLRILQAIFSYLQMVHQWIPDDFNHASELSNNAEALIDILESDDCGITGGYDNENPLINVTGHILYDRFLTLLKKYDDEKNIKEECGFTPKTLGDYYRKISNL